MSVKYRILIFLGIVFVSAGCISNKRVIYMQDIRGVQAVREAGRIVPSKFDEYFLQLNDVVEINIKTTDPQLNLMFDLNSSANQNRMMGGNLMTGGDIFYLTGYTLNEEGVVELPVIGEVKLVGLSVQQAKVSIEQELRKYVLDDEFFVRVRLGGTRFSALGEFNRPGKYTILQNRVTIFEAIANAGDLTVLAKRDNVMLIRQYPEGSRTYRVNLNNKDIIGSEFYFIRPNDMIYAEPMKVRELGTGVSLIQTFQVMVSVLTAAILVYTATSN
jgi:polysaccharide biosynthesis/export protein